MVPLKVCWGLLAVHGGLRHSSVSRSSLIELTGDRSTFSNLRSRFAPTFSSAIVVPARLPALSPRRGSLIARRRTAVASSDRRSVIAILSSDSILGGGPPLHFFLNQGQFSLIESSYGSGGLEWMVLFDRLKSGSGLGFDGSFPNSSACSLFLLRPVFLYVMADLTLSTYDDNCVLGVGFMWLSIITLLKDYWLFVAVFVFNSRSCDSPFDGCLPFDTDFSASHWSFLFRMQFSLSKDRFRWRNGCPISKLCLCLRSCFCLDLFLCIGCSFICKVVISCTTPRK